jgi:transcriptional regulator with XRE-family HTH domain
MTAPPGPGRLAECIRGFRARAGLSQRALAYASGLGDSTVALIESGRRGAGDQTLDALADALELSTAERAVLRDARDERRSGHKSNRALIEELLAEVRLLRADLDALRERTGH